MSFEKDLDNWITREDDYADVAERELAERDLKDEMNTCERCGGNLKYYDGCLGYEAMVCEVCGTHHTHEGVFPPLDKAVKK